MKWIIDLLSRMFRNSVSKDVCAEIQKRNAVIIENLEDCIEGAERRTSTRFVELKDDMRRGFTEVKELIKEWRLSHGK